MKKTIKLICVALAMCFVCLIPLASCKKNTPNDEAALTDTKQNESDTVQEGTGDNDMKPNTTTIASITPSNGKKLKIAFIGDSITEGIGTQKDSALGSYPNSYPAQLQKMIDSDKYEIGNFGKGGSWIIPMDSKYQTEGHKKNPSLAYKNTQQYKDSIAFEPDVVVIMLGVNDVRSMSDIGGWDAITQSNIALAQEYAQMKSVQKVYISTSIRICNAAAIIQGCDGPLQEAQRKAASDGGFELIDIYAATRDYMNVKMHSTGDRVHPNAEIYGEMARFYKAALFGEEYTASIPEKTECGVVFLKSDGKATGKGESPANAVNSLAAAVSLLRDGGGKIVICGAYTTTYEPHLPKHSGTITVSSRHEGTDYGASAGAKLGIKNNLYLYGDYVFENLAFGIELANSIIICNYNNVKFGDGLVCTLSQGITSYPLILVGYNIGIGGVPTENISLHGECNITVNSGTWAYIRGGNRRSNQAFPIGGSDADAKLNITINGGSFMNSAGNNMTAATGQNSFSGQAVLTINGGSFRGDVYAVGRVGGNTTNIKPKMTGNVSLVITGGEFSGKIGAVQDSTTTSEGKVSVQISEKYASKLVGFTDVTKM